MICSTCKHLHTSINPTTTYCNKAYAEYSIEGYGTRYHPSCSYDPKLQQLYEPGQPNDHQQTLNVISILREKNQALQLRVHQLEKKLLE